jgi:integrase
VSQDVSKMNNQTKLAKRGATYYFRAKIPVDLIAHYGKKEFKVSLKTTDKREAIRLCNLKAVEWDEELERIRGQRAMSMGKHAPQKIARFDEDTIAKVANFWVNQALEADVERRLEGLDERELEEMSTTLAENGVALRAALSKGDIKPIEPVMHTVLHMLGIEAEDRDETSYRRLAFRFMEAAAKANDLLLRRNKGEVIDTEKEAPTKRNFQPAARKTVKISIQDLFDYWQKAVPGRSPKTVGAYQATALKFAGFVHDKPAAELKRADILTFRDHLQQKEGKHFKTVENQLAHICAILSLGVENEKLDANVAKGIKVSKPKVPPITRMPYDHADLKKILASPLYTKRDRPKAGRGEAAVWLPLLALFTGARLEEMGQLHVSNIEQHSSGHWYLEITDIEEDHTVKTTSSRRRVPVHHELVKAGFLLYRDEMARTKEKKLFPGLTPDSKGDLTGNWSKWWGRYARREIGLQDPLKVFHSFRHTFKDACREAGLSEEIHDALTGHAGGGVGRQYGASFYPIGPLIKAIKKIQYKNVLIPVVLPIQ